jgi:hypothetical protein
VGFDSIAPACHGRPEEAEAASVYFRSVRQIGGGSLHIAHTTKGENADQRPFGSTFWFNLARSVWYAKLVEDQGAVRQLGLYHRKSNLGPLLPAVGFELEFSPQATAIRRTRLADVPELARGLSLTQRIRGFLRSGAKTREQIAAEFDDVKADSLKRTLNRALAAGQLVRFPAPDGERIGVSQ